MGVCTGLRSECRVLKWSALLSNNKSIVGIIVICWINRRFYFLSVGREDDGNLVNL